MFKTIFLVIGLSCIVMCSTQAAVPQLINYQGRLTDAGGNPVANGANLVKFTIYPAAVGGISLWNSGSQNVTTEDGFFSYELGSNVALPDDLFTDTSRYLGITVGVDPELSPRTRLESATYAYHALRADTALYAESSTGVTQRFKEGEVVTTGFLVLLMTDSINCPAAGYVMVSASLGMNCSHTNGDEDIVFFLIVDNTFTVTTDQDNNAWSLPTALSSQFYSTLMTVQKVFPVVAGWNKFNVMASHQAVFAVNNVSYSDLTTTMLYIPNAYGNVSIGTTSPHLSPLNSLPKKMK